MGLENHPGQESLGTKKHLKTKDTAYCIVSLKVL